jgi:hypothetical protein
MSSGNPSSSSHQEHTETPKADSNSGKIENSEDDWETDPANARNWSSGRKWIATAIVSALDYFFISFLFRGKSSFFFLKIGGILHFCFSTGQCNDGTWST